MSEDLEFGVRAADAVETEGEGDYLRSFKPGDNVVRWCEETDDWIKFWEHYQDKKSYPCTGDRDRCPGCNSEDENEKKGTLRYGTTVKLIERDMYVPIRVPSSVYKKMVTRSERNDGTILNRDYIVIKEGKLLNTEYDVEADSRYEIPDLKANRYDIKAILKTSYYEIWGDGRKSVEDESQDEPEKESPEDDDEVVSERELKKMPIRELRGLARKYKVDKDTAELGTKPELVDAIIAIAETEQESAGDGADSPASGRSQDGNPHLPQRSEEQHQVGACRDAP